MLKNHRPVRFVAIALAFLVMSASLYATSWSNLGHSFIEDVKEVFGIHAANTGAFRAETSGNDLNTRGTPNSPTAILLSWNTFGNAGTETSEPSLSNDPALTASNLTLGAGVTAAANTNRFGGSAWFDTGDATPTTLAESVAGNDYIEFIVTPNAGFNFTPTSLVFVWDRSGTGPPNVTLRSSVDGFTSDLGTVTGIATGAFANNTITISGLTNLASATTFRLYGYGGTGAGGTGGFDINTNTPNVTLNGTLTAPDNVPPVLTYTPLPSTTSTSNPILSVTATDAVGVTGATIFWSVDGGLSTSNACSFFSGTAQNGTWNCTITGALTNPSTISYYVTGQDAAANAATNPSGGAFQPNVFTIGAATVPSGTYTNFNAGGGSTTGGDVTITGVLDLNGIISTPTTISLGCNATVNNAGAANYVVGTVNKDYCGPGFFSYPVGDNGYTPVTAAVTAAGTFPSSLSATSYDAFLTGFDTGQSLSRNWGLVETGSVVADLSFTYLPGDVNGTESNYRVWRREDSGILTDMCGAPCNAGAPTLGPVNGVSVFSRWTGSESLAPTAAGVKVSGRVLMPSGAGLRNAKVLMTDSQGVTRTVTTSTFGYYAFDDVRSGETYVMRVVSKRFRYASRTVQVNDEVAGLDFVGLE